MPQTVDVAVIGAGHQGLVAAATLAEAGLEVAVLEAADEIGGATRSGEITAPGSVHDLYATNLNLFLGSPFYERHAAELASYGLAIAHSAHPYASVFPDGTALPISCDLAETEAMLGRHSTADLAGWRRLRQVFDDVAAAYGPVYTHPVPSRHTAAALRAVWRGRRSTPPSELARIVLASTRRLGERYLETPEARSLMAAWGMHLDYGPDITGGAIFPLLECFGDALGGMSVVAGGMGNLPRALARMVEVRGGTVQAASAVDRIVLRDGRARELVLTDGRRVSARVGVLSTAVLPRTQHLLRDAATPAAMTSAARGYRFGPGTFMVHLTTDRPVPWSHPELGKYAYVHQGGYVDDLARTYQQSLAGLLPDRPLIVVGQTSVVDPSRTDRPDRHVVWLQARTVPAEIRGDAAGGIGARSWADATAPFTDRILDLVEHNAPGFRASIVAQRSLSPADLEHANANLVGGDSGAGSHHLDQFLAFRPSLALSRYRTPVDGLYLAGAGTWPGGGVNGISGELAARTLLRGVSRARTAGGRAGRAR